MLKKCKKNAGIIVFVALVLILAAMIVDYMSVPVYAERIVCGTRICICYCVDPNGYCYCYVEKNVSCICHCPANNDLHYCYV